MSVPTYRPGTWTGVASPGFVALLDPSVDAAKVLEVWRNGSDGVLGALAVLARDGFASLPAFAMVAVRGQRVHVVLRGDVEVVVSSAVGARTLVAGDVTTWSEQVLEPATSVLVRSGGADDEAGELGAWPLGDGAAPAAQVEVVLVDDEDAATVVVDGPTAAPEPVQAAAPTTSLRKLVTPVEAPHVAAPVADVPAADVPAADVPAADAPDAAPDAAPEPATGTEPEPVTDRVEVVPTSATGATDLPDLSFAPEEDLAPSMRPQEDVYAGEVPALVPLDADDLDEDELEPVEPPVAAALASVGAASLDDHDGLTILSSDLAAIRERLPSWAADWSGAQDVPAPFVSARSPQLVLSTGLVVPLDRAVLLGRAPQVARVTNRELPRLVAVPSPQQDISRTHAEVRAEDGKVVVTDLASTNGVHVTIPGEGARRLHPGEATAVEPGQVVDLGDGVTFTVERGS
ncbi:FHA domain-containing protein [Cellulomonas sp. HZM]|uniref:FHA domain-containing protein n=1 Tax=Cellulomonas sp. HZM TaxID=1454010 RepID=UPI00049347B5|nr:FHA domain-containing protein [Cellulomonas sp. HZM]